MNDVMSSANDANDDDPNYIESVYGSAPPPPLVQPTKRTDFAPWHHPVKQIIRDYQWAELTIRLVESHNNARKTKIRYFTLPGPDLLDVRFLASQLDSFKVQIEYFGFDNGNAAGDDSNANEARKGAYFLAEAALRQSGRTTDSAEVLPDRLEDIANPRSQAANRLRQQAVFDVVNIDACSHLGFIPDGRSESLFDALKALLAHQALAQDPWLLFITTRVDPELLGHPVLELQAAISENLNLYPKDFGDAIARCIDCDRQTLASDMAKTWSTAGEKFLRIFVIGVAKYLLQFFHGQHNHPAAVELASSFAYRVHNDQPDMLSLAFRITPKGFQVMPPAAGPTVAGSPLELHSALRVVDRVTRLWIVDSDLDKDDVRNDAILGTMDLLEAADYDLDAWEKWLENHPIRPMVI